MLEIRIMLSLDKDSIHAQTKSKDTTLVLFRADWCPYCQKFKPLFYGYDGKGEVRLAEAVINEDEDPMWDEFNVMVVPTLVAFRSGKEIARRNGKPAKGLTKEDLDSILSEIS
jgi:thiol-disulfide isomerase/thioredoxin